MIVVKFNDRLSISRSVDEYGRFFVNLVSCEDEVVANVSINLEMLNPNNNRLSAELLPAPLMYSVMSVVWLGATIFWSLVCIRHWTNCSPKIHLLLAMYPVFKLIISLFNAYVFNRASHMPVSVVQEYGYHLGTISFGIYFQLTLLLMAVGWGFIKDDLETDKYHVFALVSGLSVSLILEELYVQDNVSYLLIELLVLSFRAFLLAYMFFSISFNVSTLEYKIHQYNPSESSGTTLSTEDTMLMIKKYRVFSNFRIIVIFWLTLIALELFSTLLLYGGVLENWAEMLADETMDLLVYMCLA
ncbi:hypothetical protein SAMD00019534_057040 [Acytostelium subglobosum LB1]|uniref:hypothetical protein n=1 Tax=Acytostelium subglobosum LB1 TaxID=1410327 RepID=UPI0006449AD4|nr:hypothetical protein SAMD00019534_057040 [Acytostelium subglobosum LB1]GAM22529.1 hypothetical protein SAMD00019534_057040 [Acytostelium subglobosum LB1]|eukprot:XP_012754649.1 hypothetical protein SAMD00019534_057040 [Acytostelium subglobosum LB1]